MTDDQDPTGMSHLLAGLKETGPMPEDLNDRIRASLAGEQAAREDQAASMDAEESADDEAAPDASVADLPLEEPDDEEDSQRSGFWSQMDNQGSGPSRGSTRAGRWVLGIAAAAVVVMGIGGIFAVRGGDDDAADSAGATSQEAESGQEGAADEAAPADEETPAFAVTESGTTYSQGNLASQASSLYANPEQGKEVKDTSVLGSLSTAAGARDCLTRLGSPELQPVVIDVADFGDTPGVLIIAEPVPEGTPEAFAVTTGCEEIWSGPTKVDAGD